MKPPSLRVAFDARMLAMTGIGRYIRTLLPVLQPLAASSGMHLLAMVPRGVTDVPVASKLSVLSAPFSPFAQVELPALLAWRSVGLLHSPHFEVPVVSSAKQVTTIHDCAPDVVPGEMSSSWARVYYRLMMAAAIRRSDRIIAVSSFTQKELCRLHGVPLERVTVIPEGVDPDSMIASPSPSSSHFAVLRKYGLTGSYGIYVGMTRPRKNLGTLLRALGLVFAEIGPEHQFVFVGRPDTRFMDLRAEAEALGLTGHIVITGYVPDEELAILYSRAAFCAFPSLYEGFGLPVLEAMAVGTPVVTTTASAIPEVAGDAALMVDPLDTEAMAGAMLSLFRDEHLRDQLREKGFARVRQFPVQACAEATLSVYQEVLND